MGCDIKLVDINKCCLYIFLDSKFPMSGDKNVCTSLAAFHMGDISSAFRGTEEGLRVLLVQVVS